MKKQLGSVDIKVPLKDKAVARINIGALCDMALRQLAKEKPPARRFRFMNAGEVTLWQKKVCWESGFTKLGGARLIWAVDQDVVDLGIEVKGEAPKK
jgi:hypothetical protein